MKNHELDELRFGATEVENHYIDEYMAGRLSRSALLKLGTGIGMSVPLLGMFGGAAAYARTTTPASAKAGGTLRVGTLKPAIAVDPITSLTQAVLSTTGIAGEYLVYVDPQAGVLKPEIATAWKTPDGKGKTWQDPDYMKFFNDGEVNYPYLSHGVRTGADRGGHRRRLARRPGPAGVDHRDAQGRSRVPRGLRQGQVQPRSRQP